VIAPRWVSGRATVGSGSSGRTAQEGKPASSPLRACPPLASGAGTPRFGSARMHVSISCCPGCTASVEHSGLRRNLRCVGFHGPGHPRVSGGAGRCHDRGGGISCGGAVAAVADAGRRTRRPPMPRVPHGGLVRQGQAGPGRGIDGSLGWPDPNSALSVDSSGVIEGSLRMAPVSMISVEPRCGSRRPHRPRPHTAWVRREADIRLNSGAIR
jgi:hypothetical protein